MHDWKEILSQEIFEFPGRPTIHALARQVLDADTLDAISFPDALAPLPIASPLEGLADASLIDKPEEDTVWDATLEQIDILCTKLSRCVTAIAAKDSANTIHYETMISNLCRPTTHRGRLPLLARSELGYGLVIASSSAAANLAHCYGLWGTSAHNLLVLSPALAGIDEEACDAFEKICTLMPVVYDERESPISFKTDYRRHRLRVSPVDMPVPDAVVVALVSLVLLEVSSLLIKILATVRNDERMKRLQQCACAYLMTPDDPPEIRRIIEEVSTHPSFYTLLEHPLAPVSARLAARYLSPHCVPDWALYLLARAQVLSGVWRCEVDKEENIYMPRENETPHEYWEHMMDVYEKRGIDTYLEALAKGVPPEDLSI